VTPLAERESARVVGFPILDHELQQTEMDLRTFNDHRIASTVSLDSPSVDPELPRCRGKTDEIIHVRHILRQKLIIASGRSFLFSAIQSTKLTTSHADMNQRISNSEPHVPLNALPPISLGKFLQLSGLSTVTAWRYRQRGWLRTIVIAGRHYVTREAIAEFNARATRGEFAGTISNPSTTRSRQFAEN
jgi:hypothetical protein